MPALAQADMSADDQRREATESRHFYAQACGLHGYLGFFGKCVVPGADYNKIAQGYENKLKNLHLRVCHFYYPHILSTNEMG